MKLMMIGNWLYPVYEAAMTQGFENNKCEVIKFNLLENGAPAINTLSYRLRLKKSLARVNARLLNQARIDRPDVIFLYRGIEVLPSTLKAIRDQLPEVKIVLYHNDDPYGSLWGRMRSRHYLKSHPLADVVAVYRPVNVADATKFGAKRVELLMSSFTQGEHYPSDAACSRDVIFVGHYEDDGRLELIRSLVDAGVQIEVFGDSWGAVADLHPWLDNVVNKSVWGSNYGNILRQSRICLGLLSRRNRDVYTRRCFEIPACGSVLVAPRTRFLAQLFREDEEAVFFSSPEELVRKITGLLADTERCDEIARRGYERVIKDKHDETGRASEVLGWISAE